MKTANRHCIGLLSFFALGLAVLLAGGIRDDATAATWEISPETQAAIDALPPADKKRIERDTAAVRNNCGPGTIVGGYQNCACVVVHFVEERLKDLTTNRGKVEARASKAMGASCRDEAAVRATFTARCEDSHARDYGFVEESIRKDFCACYGSEVAERFMSSRPSAQSAPKNILVAANLACDSAQFLRYSEERRQKRLGQ